MKTTAKKDTLYIFISYAADDSAYADNLRNYFLNTSHTKVFTSESLSAGEDWKRKLKDALSRSHIFVLIVTQNSINSPWVMQELGAAWALKKPILQVVTRHDIGSKLPIELKDEFLVDFHDLQDPQAVSQLYERCLVWQRGFKAGEEKQREVEEEAEAEVT